MRTFRPLLAAMALLALAPLTAHAQADRSFTDSWFWGVKGGVMSFYTTQVSHAPAPLIGGEWLITRNKGALYLSLDQAFFKQNAEYTVFDADTAGNPIETGTAIASIRDMKRFTAAVMVFPMQRGLMRPYAGLGFAMNFINKATTQPGGATGAFEEQSLNDVKSGSAPVLILGTQLQKNRFSVFGQGTLMGKNSEFVFNRSTYFLEGGLRYNVGPSRERIR